MLQPKATLLALGLVIYYVDNVIVIIKVRV